MASAPFASLLIAAASLYRLRRYVEQMDIHIPYCTVREALEFSANLRLDPGISQAQNKKYVDEVMTMVDLWPIANRTIGTPGRITLPIALSCCVLSTVPMLRMC